MKWKWTNEKPKKTQMDDTLLTPSENDPCLPYIYRDLDYLPMDAQSLIQKKEFIGRWMRVEHSRLGCTMRQFNRILIASQNGFDGFRQNGGMTQSGL